MATAATIRAEQQGDPARIPALIEALQTGSPEQREEACRQLAMYATAASVPALAGLLDDPRWSHMARYAMESMPGREVDAAFLAALPNLSGPQLAGVINSIAVRRDPNAVEPLAERLHDPDAAVADAAAVALGRIGTPAAAAVLTHALEHTETPTPAVFEGALSCAGWLLEGGSRQDAVRLYDRLRVPPSPRAVRLAAARGAVVARADEGTPLLLQFLGAADTELQAIARWLAQHELPGESVTIALAAELAALPDGSKLLWIAALEGRADPAALPALESAAAAGPQPVRLAAVNALPRFGAAAKSPLLRLLDDPDAEIVQACQDALTHLPRPDVGSVAADLLQSPDAKKRLFAVTLIRRLQQPTFALDLAAALNDPSADVRIEAAKTMEGIAGAPQLDALLSAFLSAADRAERRAMEHALIAVAVRAGDPDKIAARLLEGSASAPPERQAAMPRILARLGGSRALQAVLAATAGPPSDLRSAAIDALCAWPTADAAPDLLRLAQSTDAPAVQLNCLRGALRLAASDNLPADQRLQLLDDAQTLIQRDEEKHLLLSALAHIGSIEALNRTLPFLNSPATQEEACAAILSIAARLPSSPPDPQLAAALEQVAQITHNPTLAEQARNQLQSPASDR